MKIHRQRVFRVLTTMMGLCFCSVCALPAGVEVDGYGGGLTITQGVGTSPTGGAQAGIRIGKNLRLLGEFGYSPSLFSESQQVTESGVTATGTATLRMLTYGGAADFSFGQSRVRPYGVFAMGGEHMSAGASASAAGTSSVNLSVGIGNGFYLGIGGGVRIYAGKSWGFKPEVRYMPVYATAFGASGWLHGVSYTGGFFFDFGGEK
jgi:hypothetical protein